MPSLFPASPLRGCLHRKHLRHLKCSAHRTDVSIYTCAYHCCFGSMPSLSLCHAARRQMPSQSLAIAARALLGFVWANKRWLEGNPLRWVLLSLTKTILCHLLRSLRACHEYKVARCPLAGALRLAGRGSEKSKRSSHFLNPLFVKWPMVIIVSLKAFSSSIINILVRLFQWSTSDSSSTNC